MSKPAKELALESEEAQTQERSLQTISVTPMQMISAAVESGKDLAYVERLMEGATLLKCSEFEFPLENGSLDGAFMAFVIQESSDKPRLLRAVRELLLPRGWCTILEWYRKETETGPPLERRVDPSELQLITEEAGFRHVQWRDLNGDQYMTLLRNR